MAGGIDGAEEDFSECRATTLSGIPEFEIGLNAIEPVVGIDAASGGNGDDGVLVDGREFADQFFLAEGKAEGAVRALRFAAWIKAGGNDNGINLGHRRKEGDRKGPRAWRRLRNVREGRGTHNCGSFGNSKAGLPARGRSKISWTSCRIPVRPFDYIVKAGQPARPRPLQEKRPLQENGEIMTQYLVAIHLPDDYDPSAEGEAMSRDIDALNEEMIAADVRIFAGGLRAASSAKSLRAQPGGKVLITDGPYLETKEHIGGFWILEAANLDKALAWGRKAVVACRAPVEVRPFQRRQRRSGRSMEVVETDGGADGSN